MHIDRFRAGEWGPYVDPCGVEYDSAEDFLCCSVLGFCGCGRPDDALKFLHKVLRFLAYRHTALSDPQHKPDLRDIHNDPVVKEIDRREKELFVCDGSRWFFYYVLAEKNLTEHGGSVPGWLSDTGQQLLEDLNELYAADDQR